MSSLEETPAAGDVVSAPDLPARTAAVEAGKDTRDGSQPPAGASTQAAADLLRAEALAQIRTAGLALPRSSSPGQSWSPSTPAEQHLLREGRRLDRVRQLLLAEVGNLRLQVGSMRRSYATRAAFRSARAGGGQATPCPLKDTELRALIGAAAGETPREAARRVLLAENTIKKQRLAAQRCLSARSLTHAVAVAVAAGWITAEHIIEGTTP